MVARGVYQWWRRRGHRRQRPGSAVDLLGGGCPARAWRGAAHATQQLWLHPNL